MSDNYAPLSPVLVILWKILTERDCPIISNLIIPIDVSNTATLSIYCIVKLYVSNPHNLTPSARRFYHQIRSRSQIPTFPTIASTSMQGGCQLCLIVT